MPRADRSKQLPYLTQYIRYAADWQPSHWHENVSAKTVGVGLGISLGIGGIAQLCLAVVGLAAHWGLALAAASVSFAVFFVGMMVAETKRAQAKDPLLAMRREAKQVAERLEDCAGRKRLHRDLSVEVATLLEEAACNWHRARTTLESPYWKSAELPTHLRAVREQSLLAVDQGMQELLVLFSTSVPAKPGNWSIGELIDEAVGQDIFATRGRVEHISPFYDQGRSVAHKLMELADQVESVSRQLAGQELVTGAPKPGSALEATLAELKQLKQAEDELRQDLRA
jgi:hypothetical protein